MKLYRLYILDLDGTLYRGSQAIPHASHAVAELRKRGAQIRFLTNNSGQTREFYHKKLTELGFPCERREIYSSAAGAAKHCNELGVERVYYVGEPGLRETLLDSGLEVVNEAEAASKEAQAVVAGICRQFTYAWMNAALQQLLKGAKFIATNTDATYPVESGRVEPGAGSIVASIQAASGCEPFVVGKPNPYLLNLILKEANCGADEALAVGDRYETDILSGRNAGVDTHLVLTGVTQAAPEDQSWSADLLGLL